MGNLDLDKIQGNIVPGFNKDHQAFVFVRFQSAEQGRNWLGEMQADLASANQVQRFRQTFNELRQRAPHGQDAPDGGALQHISATWVNLALAHAGIRLMAGAAAQSGLPNTFRFNRVPGVASAAQPEVHALLIVGADRCQDLEDELAHQRQRLAATGTTEVQTFRGDALPGAQRGHEHFGFKDGISQPRIAGYDWGCGADVAPGEFVLGYPDQTGASSGSGLPAWTQNGSFVAFLQLQQHVATFWTAMQQHAQQLGVQAKDLASCVVGRTEDGAMRSTPPARLSHIGRAYSRWLGPNEALRHRIIRRGLPYGPAWTPGEADGAVDRGLLFVSYQADLERQFEHVWTQWLGDRNFPLPGAGTDALTGQKAPLQPGVAQTPWTAASTRPTAVTRANQMGGYASLSLPSFVTPGYGGYFFAPAIGTTFTS
ncbi:MAG: Dyp-type peroxidase [Chloroflexi bacterium]|nr:Dyp-type peroxidase [Chloroflexota bacterium]MBV9898505.1 Dyp-type peroxidase [Chloroflexota bacterium]